jgi:hypothetical protein
MITYDPPEQSSHERLARACRDILDLRQALLEAHARKNAALVAINEDGVPKRWVAQRAREYLLSGGDFTVLEVSHLALSPASVRLALDSPERPEPSEGQTPASE